jgi:hypothetical protein
MGTRWGQIKPRVTMTISRVLTPASLSLLNPLLEASPRTTALNHLSPGADADKTAGSGCRESAGTALVLEKGT